VARELKLCGGCVGGVARQVWEMLDDPTSSTGAALLMSVIMMLILFSTCTFLVETLPQFYVHNPEKYNVWCVRVVLRARGLWRAVD
jgi:hypothetical protein